ncbi:MAG: hypothetical protein U0931_23890 [Vulcanimicrobiota bacterium]
MTVRHLTSARRLLIAYGNEMQGDEGASWELARRAAAVGWPVLCLHHLHAELLELLHDLDEVVFVNVAQQIEAESFQELNARNVRNCPGPCSLPAQLLRQCFKQHGQAPSGWAMTLRGDDFGTHLGLSDSSRVSVELGLKRLDSFFPTS